MKGLSRGVVSGGNRRGLTVAWLAGFLTLLLVGSALLGWLEATRKVDRLIYDSWVRLHQHEPPDDVVIAAIDPQSLARLGRWPWSRALQSQVLEELARLGVRGVVIDILHIEPGTPEEDQRLGRAVASLPVSILPVLVERGTGGTVSERLPIPELTRAVSDLGHIVLPIDDDGIVRRVHLKAGFSRAHWPALSLAALAQFSPNSDIVENLPGERIEQETSTHRWTYDHEALVPYIGTSGSFARVSAARIASGEVARSELAGKIVFFGLATTGLGDVVPTPVSALEQPMAGIEVHANVFAALRDGSLISRAPAWVGPLVALFVLPLLLLIYLRAEPRWSLPGALIGALVPLLISFLLYRHAQLWYAPLSASVPLLASYLVWSRHRLEYINRFLEREQAKLSIHQSERDRGDDSALTDFFVHASRHLPIRGWRFETRESAYSSGKEAPSGSAEAPIGSWAALDGVYSKRYRTPGQLRIDMSIDDSVAATEITAYVDSLARIRTRVRPVRSRGSVERLQANAERLREQMAWLRGVKAFSESVLAGVPIGLIVWNPAGEWVRGNALAIEMLPGLEERALLIDFMRVVGHELGDPIREADLTNNAPRFLNRERFDALLFKGVPWQIAHERDERALVINFSAVGDKLSRKLICASVIDVSEIRSAERARAELVDYLSHDLRSPLVSALAMLGDADSDPALGAQRAAHEPPDAASYIRSSLAMMDELLHVARADSLSEERFSDLMLDDVLGNAIAELQPQARARNMALQVNTSDEELWMSGDAGSLERTVTNLIGNAIKYSPDGATVRIDLHRNGDEGVLVVDDDGVGIDPAVIGELFTRFRRDARVAGRIAGTGLGLAFVARVVRRHEGTIHAASEPGRGTRVTMRLPLERVVVDDSLSPDAELLCNGDARPGSHVSVSRDIVRVSPESEIAE